MSVKINTYEKYKYNPEDFVAMDMSCLANELKTYYQLLEIYHTKKTKLAKSDLKCHWWENLFFTIKHREVEGSLSPTDADEMRSYLEELMYTD